MTQAVTLYFSLRSPYSWLALHRLDRLGDRLGAKLRMVPVYPRGEPGFNDPAASPLRLRYLLQDVGRMARAYGLEVRPPPSVDTRWELPHAAWTHADDEGRGLAFALAAGSARFGRGRDLGLLEVLGEVAQEVGLEPSRVIEAAQDPARHARVDAGIAEARDAGVFGVPYFVHSGQHYWGNDRLEWLLRELDRAHGRCVEDLGGEACVAPPWRPDRT